MKTILPVFGILLLCFVAMVHATYANDKSWENIETTSKAAKQGDADAQFNLGRMHYDGKGIPQDYKQAASCYQKAARQGHTKAQNMLGQMYFAGKGLKKNYTRSAYWWSKSAKQGDATAQSLLGTSYSRGKGVPQDYKRAYAWMSLALAQGDFTTKDTRDLAVENLSSQELLEAKELLTDIQYQIEHPDETHERIGSTEQLTKTESNKRGEPITQINGNKLEPKNTPSLSGVYLRSYQSDVESLKLMNLVDGDAGKDKASKFGLVNGNELSVTYRDSKVVFIELDWMENKEAVDTGVLDFKFNETSLKEIRRVTGNNGFAFERIFYSDRDVEFNSYEVIGYTDCIIVFITKPTVSEETTEDNIAATAKLVSIILAEKSYLDELWGSKKIFDTNYKPINVELSNSAPTHEPMIYDDRRKVETTIESMTEPNKSVRSIAESTFNSTIKDRGRILPSVGFDSKQYYDVSASYKKKLKEQEQELKDREVHIGEIIKNNWLYETVAGSLARKVVEKDWEATADHNFNAFRYDEFRPMDDIEKKAIAGTLSPEHYGAVKDRLLARREYQKDKQAVWIKLQTIFKDIFIPLIIIGPIAIWFILKKIISALSSRMRWN